MATQTHVSLMQHSPLNCLGSLKQMKLVRWLSQPFKHLKVIHLKLSARHSINRSVRYNDLSLITGMSLNKLRKQPEQVENVQYELTHQNLKEIRKKYDNLNRKRVQKDQNIQKLQVEKLSYKNTQDELKQKKQNGNTQVSKLESDLNSIKLSLQEAQTNKKVMANMISRLKSDKITYDLRKYFMEKELKSIFREKKTILDSSRGINEEQSNTKDIYVKYVNHLEAEKKEREEHLASVQSMIDVKIEVNQRCQNRRQEMIAVAEEAMEQKDANEKNWAKIYLTHRFVDKVLRSKIEIELNKFHVVESAFKIIKTATGVSDADTLVKKFLNKEKVYGELLAKIAENQRKMNQLKSDHQELIKERKELKEENQLYNTGNKSNPKNDSSSKEAKQLQNISLKNVNCELLNKKIQQWLFRNFKKLNAIENKKDKIKITSDKTKIIEKFKYFLGILSNAVEEIKGEEKQFDNKKDLFVEANGEGLFRAKPKVFKLSSSGQEIENEFQEEQIASPYDEDDCLNSQRNEALKKNEKFMKQLKKKYEDIKKAKIDAEPKKKDPIPQKPKNPPPPMD